MNISNKDKNFHKPENAPRVGVAAAVMRGGRLLLIQRNGAHGGGTWAVPGGHLEYGESPEDCAVRELQEEVGLKARGARFIGITNDVYIEKQAHYITLWMAMDAPEGEPFAAAPEEVADLGWFAPDALPAPPFQPFASLLAGQSSPPDAWQKIQDHFMDLS